MRRGAAVVPRKQKLRVAMVEREQEAPVLRVCVTKVVVEMEGKAAAVSTGATE